MKEKLLNKIKMNEERLQSCLQKKENLEREIRNLELKIENEKVSLRVLESKEQN